MKNHILILVTISSIIFILSTPVQTFSTTQGMHTFMVKPSCDKCHPEIQSQLNQSDHSSTPCNECHKHVDGVHVTKLINCEYCHQPNSNNIHTTTYPVCSECHISHGALKQGYGHNNATFMQTHPCMSCHVIHG